MLPHDMIGLDTNVVVRLLTDDDPPEKRIARRCVERMGRGPTAFMPLVAVLEWDWSLRSNLGFSRRAAVKAISRLLQTCGLVAEHHEPVVKALPMVSTDNADFADALIAGRSQQAGCGSIKTFDRKAARNIAGMELFA